MAVVETFHTSLNSNAITYLTVTTSVKSLNKQTDEERKKIAN